MEQILSIEQFESDLIASAKAIKQRIVLPEGECDRVLKAAHEALAQDIADIIILGNSIECKCCMECKIKSNVFTESTASATSVLIRFAV